MTGRGFNSVRGNRHGENARRKSTSGGRAPVLARYGMFYRLGSASASGTYVTPVAGFYDVFAWGPGGNGGRSPGTASSNGGGGAAGYSRVLLDAGVSIPWSLGPGANTVVTLPSGVCTARAGTGGSPGYEPGGPGGTASGFDINRTGGLGAGFTNPDGDPDTADGVGVSSGSPMGGGTGSLGGGGGSAGFDDLGLLPALGIDIPSKGDGTDAFTTVGNVPGGGAAGISGAVTGDITPRGGFGQLLIVVSTLV